MKGEHALRTLWLGEDRGHAADWTTQFWVKATGRRVELPAAPWLEGPIGRPEGIGRHYFDELAHEHGLEVRRTGVPRGLLPSVQALAGPGFDPSAVHPAVVDFYERTSEYELEAWAEWCGVFRPFGHLLAVLFSRRLQQLNVPLSALDASHGTTSEVLQLVDPASGAVRYTAWVRELLATGNVLYAGSYSITRVPGLKRPCVRVVFPLPNGNGMVFLRPDVDPSGALTVTSAGRRFGDPGFYFSVHDRRRGRTWARYVRTMRESIRVYAADADGVRADHTMWIWGATFLRLHYRLRRRANIGGAAT
jgi:hypothetical protein